MQSVAMASSETIQVANVDVLESSHRQAFERALMRVLQTEAAEQAYAEIIDGLPTRLSYAEFHCMQDGHPATYHHELCPGILEKAREFRLAFTVADLSFKLPVSSFRALSIM